MKTIDLNADIGEADTPEWAASEAAIVSAISSANIACGGHAGDRESMRLTVRQSKAAGVTIGAHPAYPDRENFGRLSLKLDEDCLLYTSPSPRDQRGSRMPSSA